ncbi:hypothetical protein [Aureimonas sp. SK2]|uniref:hypothetical protein n=1 Tax=Aureimonas sp. SK2 TaxID=3015992 RepID=UPI0024442BC8|nr:hypothetical protein [Aureimonas sp. SK2]
MLRDGDDPKVGQVYNWYLDCAADGTHSAEGIAKKHLNLTIQRSLIDSYIPGDFRRLSFAGLDTRDMQALIDAAAASGAETAAEGLKSFFVDVEKFGVWKGIIERFRTRKLKAPSITRRDRALNDREFRAAFDAYRMGAEGGAVVDRGPCLAILVSAITLQPIANLLHLRRADIDFERSIWVNADSDGARHFVHMPKYAAELLQRAIALGDFCNRTEPTELVFPENGQKGDPKRSFSYASIYEVTDKLLPRQDIKPTDLAWTGITSLRGLKDERVDALVERILFGCKAEPAQGHVALMEGWMTRLYEMIAPPKRVAWR